MLDNLVQSPGILDVPDLQANVVAGNSVSDDLEKRRFKANQPPPPLRPLYTLLDTVICTPGNLTSITAAIKVGKSTVLGAMTASTMASGSSADLLGFSGANPKGLAVLHFDSEQPPDDHWRHNQRALKRVGLLEAPEWYASYCLTGLGPDKSWGYVLEAARVAALRRGGLHSILLDGVADFVLDVNDPRESNAFIARLHETAIFYDCAIIGVIHFNPGTDKSRGHLGSQFERKAETNLRLDKKDGVTTIWSDKQRRAPIPKDLGARFQWDADAGMHMSCVSREESRQSARVERMRSEVLSLLPEGQNMSYSDLKSTVKSRLSVSESTAQRRIRAYRQAKFVKKSGAGRLVSAC